MVNTELALLCYPDQYSEWCSDTSYEFQDTKAFYAVQGYTMALRENLRANIWYSINGWRASGLFASGLNPLPAYNALTFMSNLVNDARSVDGLNLHPSVHAYEFNLGGRQVWVLWSADGGTHLVNFGATPDSAWNWKTSSHDYGTTSTSSSMSIGVAPVFLEWVP